MFKIGDRVLVQAWNQEVFGRVVSADRVPRVEWKKNHIAVRWEEGYDYGTPSDFHWEAKSSLTLVVEPNDILKDLCSK